MYVVNLSFDQRIEILNALSNQMRYLEDRIDSVLEVNEKLSKAGYDRSIDSLKLSHYRETLENTRSAWEAIVSVVSEQEV